MQIPTEHGQLIVQVEVIEALIQARQSLKQLITIHFDEIAPPQKGLQLRKHRVVTCHSLQNGKTIWVMTEWDSLIESLWLGSQWSQGTTTVQLV